MSLDGYDVIRELGRGGMAVVHLARQRDLGRLVALKELGRFNADDPAFAERFLRESRTIGSLNHPNIVTVYEYFEDSGTPYIAMELIEGGSLRPLIGEMTLPKVARVLEDALAAIGHAATAGIVHRDLKPENALVTIDGRVKVADFGIAKAAEGGQSGLTSEGMTVGTPEYMSPEQALASDVGPRSDLYALGCMTFEMLTGRLPFMDTAQGALLVKQVSEPVPDVRDIDPLIPEPVALWVMKMTEKDPEDRYEGASTAWEALEEILLEINGPLWRRDAVLAPASTIDISQIPPQTDRPLRPPGKAGQQPPPKTAGSMTGYQTYHAPAALHEILGSDSDASPAVLTPPPQRISRPLPRATPTPPPQRIPTGPQPVKTAEPVETEPAVKKVPVGAIAGGAAVAAIVAFVLGMSGGGSAATASASGDGFVLNAPEGWAKADAGIVPGLGGQAVALAPPGVPAGEGVAASRMPAADATALTSGGGDAKPITLGAGEAVSFEKSGATLYIVPTNAGTLVIGCTAGTAVKAACAEVAGATELTRGEAVAPGPTDDGARTLGGSLNRLRDGIRNPTQDLSGAGSASEQATAAGDLSKAYREAANEVRGLQLGALANGPRDQLANALRSMSRGWSAFARGARGGNVNAARSSISGARARIRRARAALVAVGYSEGGAG